MSIKYAEFMAQGYQKLLDEGFYEYLGVKPPKGGMGIIYHDILDHAYSPLWGVIPPTVEGEILAAVNHHARMVIRTYGTVGNVDLIQLLHGLFFELPLGNGKYEDKTSELTAYLEREGEHSIFVWYRDCRQFWSYEVSKEVMECIKF